MTDNIRYGRFNRKPVYKLFDMSPKVHDLYLTLGLKIYSYSEIADMGRVLGAMWNNTRGMYYPSLDIIGLNDYLMENRREVVDMVVLHEIGHWTGYSKRLARPWVLHLESLKGFDDSIESRVMRDLEELMAEMIMYKLAENLDVATEFHKNQLESSFEMYSNLSCLHHKCFDRANEATEYVMDIFNQNRKAA